MNADLSKLPDDAVITKAMHMAVVKNLEVQYQEQIEYLEQMVSLYKKELFGRSSEKRHEPHADQLPLFN